MLEPALLESLPLRQRLALAYGRGPQSACLAAVLALDARMAGILRGGREPMLVQMRLAWWRERLAEAGNPAAEEPLLALLAHNGPPARRMVALVDAWEGLTGPAPLPDEAFDRLARARAEALAGDDPCGQAMARAWALADLAGRVSHPRERACLAAMAAAADWRRQRLPRALRPLAILHALARHDLRRSDNGGRLGPAGLMLAIRVGLFGL